MISVAFLSTLYLYQTKVEGLLHLENAPGPATISTEVATGIQYMKADTLESVLFA